MNNMEVSAGPRRPFPGLRPFEPGESELFFGRGDQIDELLARLEDHRFVAVVGASGSGKSSLVRAGLLPSPARAAATPTPMLTTRAFASSSKARARAIPRNPAWARVSSSRWKAIC